MAFKKKTPPGSTQTTVGAQFGPLELQVRIEQWPLATPFHITDLMWEVLDVLVVTLEKDGRVGRGEAAGVYYKAPSLNLMLHQIETLRNGIESGISRTGLPLLLPAGGASSHATSRRSRIRRASASCCGQSTVTTGTRQRCWP
jgi:L-Ala-D/L-Glu epimerase